MSDLSQQQPNRKLTPAELAKVQANQAEVAADQGKITAPQGKIGIAGAETGKPTFPDVVPPATPQLTPQEATALGLSASDVAVPMSLETTGHVKPKSPDQPQAPAAPPSPVAPVPMASKPVGPVVGKQAPAVKDIVKEIISGGSGADTPSATSEEGKGDESNFLKTAAGKLGDFLQRWGMGLQGAPTGATQGDIQRAQQFELQKQQAQAQVMARQQALENQYQVQRMQLQNQMNIANIPLETKARIQAQIATLDAEYQNQIRLLPLQIQKEFAMRQWLPGADPAAHILDQGK